MVGLICRATTHHALCSHQVPSPWPGWHLSVPCVSFWFPVIFVLPASGKLLPGSAELSDSSSFHYCSNSMCTNHISGRHTFLRQLAYRLICDWWLGSGAFTRSVSFRLPFPLSGRLVPRARPAWQSAAGRRPDRPLGEADRDIRPTLDAGDAEGLLGPPPVGSKVRLPGPFLRPLASMPPPSACIIVVCLSMQCLSLNGPPCPWPCRGGGCWTPTCQPVPCLPVFFPGPVSPRAPALAAGGVLPLCLPGQRPQRLGRGGVGRRLGPCGGRGQRLAWPVPT